MKFSQEDVILIKNFYLSKRYGARRVFSELSEKGSKLGSIDDSLLKRSHKTGTLLSCNHAAVDRVCRVAVEDLVLNQEDKSKRHRSAR